MRAIGVFLALGAAVWAADPKPPAAQAANEQVQISATLYPDRQALQRELGSDLGGYFLVVKVNVAPKRGNSLAVAPDDFVLRSDKDGQRSPPMAPSQIAGRGALIVSSTGGGGLMAENPGPAWGGIGGGRPGRLGGGDATMGNAGGGSAQGTIDSGMKQKEDPLLAVLKQRALPVKTVKETISGLVYFLLEGKHKPKDLELLYSGPAGKLSMRFRR